MATANHRPLYVPAGTYKTSIALARENSGLVIYGDGQSGTTLEAADSSAATISMSSGTNWVTVRDLSIKNSGRGNNGTHYGIRMDEAAYVYVSNVFVSGYNTNILITKLNTTDLSNVYSMGAVYDAGQAGTSGHGLYASHPSAGCGLNVERSQFMANQQDGMRLLGIASAYLDQVFGQQNGGWGLYYVGSGSAGLQQGPWMTNTGFDMNNTGGVYLQDVLDSAVTNMWVSAAPTAKPGYGLMLSNSIHGSFTNVHAYNSAGIGIYLANQSHSNSFSSPQVVGNGLAGDAANADGIRVDAQSWGNIFTGLAAWNNTGAGFRFLDKSPAKPNEVVGFHIEGNGGGQYEIQPKDVAIGSVAGVIMGQTITLSYSFGGVSAGFGARLPLSGAATSIPVYTMPQKGSIVSMSVSMGAARTAGSLTAYADVNSVSASALQVQINESSPQYATALAAAGTVPLAAGDRVAVYVASGPGWLPASDPINVTLTVLLQ